MKNIVAKVCDALFYPGSKIRKSQIRLLGRKFRYLSHVDDSFIGAAARGEKDLHQQDLSELQFIIDQAKDAAVVFDIGANIGLYATTLSRVYPNKAIISIEPDPTNFALLVLNLKENACENVIPINVALSNSEGWLKFFRNSVNPGDSMSFRPDGEYISARKTSLSEETVRAVESGGFIDSLLHHLKNPAPRFFKIDTQGMEIRILESLSSILKPSDRLSIELSPHHLKMCGTSQIQTIETLSQFRSFQKILGTKSGVLKVDVTIDEITDYIAKYPNSYSGYWDLLIER